MKNNTLFAVFEFGESFLANGLGLVLFPIMLYDFGINIYQYSLIIGFSNLIAFFINILLLQKPGKVINKLFLFSALTSFAGIGLLNSSKYMFALFFAIFTIIHMQGLLFYQISILETKELKFSSSLSSILGYIGYATAIVFMFLVKNHSILIVIGIFIYFLCGFLFYKFSDKNIILSYQDIKVFKEKSFLKYAFSVLALSIAPQFFNNSMTMYLKSYLFLGDKKIYILMAIGLFFAIISSFLLSKIWKRESYGFYITAIFWITVYLLAIGRFFIIIHYTMFYGILLAIIGGLATGFFWTFFKAITALKFNDKNVAIRISMIYGLSSSIGPILFYLLSNINPIFAFIGILILVLLSIFSYILFFGF